MQLKGTITAIITPFKNNLLDEEALSENIEYQIESGIDAIVVLGTTGENPTLTKEESEKAIQIAVSTASHRIPIIVGTGHYSTQEAIEKTCAAKKLGADGALIVTPYYNKPTQEGIFRHFEAITKSCDLPIMVYNIAGRTGVNIETNTLARIAKLPSIFGVKEASSSITQAADVIAEITLKNKNFSVFSGDDALALPMIALGGVGVVSVISNLLPKEMSSLVNLALNGDFIAARKLHYDLLPIMKGLFIETNPIPIKEAMNRMGMKAGNCRLPLCEMKEENKEKLKVILDSSALINSFKG